MLETILYIILGLVIVFIAMRFALVLSMKRKQGAPVPEIDGKLGKSLRQGKKVLIYFTSPSCPPCAQMSPVVDEFSKNHPHVFKVDVSREMAVARKFGVMGTPALVLVESSLIKQFIMGPQALAGIEKVYNS
jgi:thioredoxin 1